MQWKVLWQNDMASISKASESDARRAATASKAAIPRYLKWEYGRFIQ